MRTSSILVFIAMTALSVSVAFAQGAAKKSAVGITYATKFEDLNASEKKTAAHLLEILTPEERGALKKSAQELSCMIDSQAHTPARREITMSRADKVQLASAIKKLTSQEVAVSKKLVIMWARMGLSAKHGSW